MAQSASDNGDQVQQEAPDRGAQTVSHESPPRLPFPIVAMGASAGGLEAFIEFFDAMPGDSGMAFVLILHLPPDRESMIAAILSKHARMPVDQVEEGIKVEPNHIYVIRPGHTLTIKEGVLHLGQSVNQPRHGHPVDDFFRSLAEEQRERTIGVVLSGMGSNGTAGAETIKAVGGVIIAQDPESAKYSSMPRHLIESGNADFVLRADEMPPVLMRYAQHPYVSGPRLVDTEAQRDQKHYSEIVSLLRARTHRDFTGYKRPTVLRRIQRRMGLNQIEDLGQYVQFLRQNGGETNALSDDLLINVSGFFRDPEAWEALRKEVIVPLMTERDNDAPIRCWVTACASGEEAYTLSMLLHEAAEQAGKAFDIKVFATDTADRTLSRARQGTFPQGIEAEVSPERLERYFDPDDAFYRIKKEIRELVVFAPHNVINDPPFSKIDICTCRNLLIYLEPDIQRRVLSMLHFGIREGGTLFLGSSEAISGADDLFEPIDKRLRIFRRVGPTRHGQVEFAYPPVTPNADVDLSAALVRGGKASIGHITTRVLLDRHTPPAVTVDRHFRVVYYHGDTSLYLNQPAGEPTRDVISLARDNVRGAIRTALHHATSQNKSFTARDGCIESDSNRLRVEVTASPLDSKLISSPHYLVTFEARPEPSTQSAAADGDNTDNVSELQEELQRVRDELQSTIEELQSSNEEMRASNEETMSINEELQSTNEELETSKEELQSLNEELTTVNVQLQAKMDELEGTTSDLSSLLSSTDIAVLFLDTRFRIRRFTPALKDLIELIPSDIGRPLSDLAKKFDDADLLPACQAVLDRLVPLEAEVRSASGKQYLRRVLPYRTTDNRINGVVITFFDVTDRKRIEDALRRAESNLRTVSESATDFAMLLIDPAGRISTWNAGAEQMLGWSQAEAVGQPAAIIFPAETRDAQWQREREQAEKLGRAADEGWHVRKNGTRLWGSGVLAVVREFDGQLSGFVKVLRDETARKRAEDDLAATLVREKAARREAESHSELKDQFLSTLSHELRTPLSAILAWSQMLQSDMLEQAEREEGLRVIEENAHAQKYLLNDLLDTSRITSGKLRLDRQLVELDSLLKKAFDAVLGAARDNQVALHLEPEDCTATLWADPDRLLQVLGNLLTNAIKFTPAGGKVTVLCKNTDGWAEIAISDTGKGIDPKFMPQLFTPFTQGDNSSTRSHGGLGLGLAISKELVELHGGTIEAHSDGVDQGARFVVRLPFPPPGQIDVRQQRQHSPVESVNNDALNRATILLVEDDSQSRAAFERTLRKAGADVKAVASAAEALRLFEQSQPRLVISDIGLPEQDGYALMQQIRSLERERGWQTTPAVALTAFAGSKDRHKAREAGYNLHVAKPIEPAALVRHALEILREPLQSKTD